jgi:hopanoid biosynthesis associated radical SAM protein HpnJ
MLKTLFLNPPSYEGFDGGAGARYQNRREVRSFWYPTWLAQPAALVPGSRLIDAPPDDLASDDVLREAGDADGSGRPYDLCIIHTSTPTFTSDARLADAMKQRYPEMRLGFVGAHGAVLPEKTLREAPALEFVCGKEFDYTVREIAEGRPLAEVDGITYRAEDGSLVATRSRALIHDMDALPSVLDVYENDLTVPNYFIGYLQHPYISLYTGRGCPAQCTFCLWPQTIGGHAYRVRSAQSVYEEMARVPKMFPDVKEIFFDDDTFTADRARTTEVAPMLGSLGIEWSCNSRANVPYETLKLMKENGLRLLLVGFESGNDRILRNIKKGVTVERAVRFMNDCKKLGIRVHGTFILGLPGESLETIQQTIEFAIAIDPNTIQVSLAAPYPGTELYAQAQQNGWLISEEQLLLDNGAQDFPMQYPDLDRRAVFNSVEDFYRRFYFRPKPILRIMKDMVKDPDVRRRRLREGKEFFQYMRQRREAATKTVTAP